MAPTMQPIPLDGQTLPESFIRAEADRPKVAYDAFSNEIPVISLANVDNEDDGVAGGLQAGRRAEARMKIAEACEEWGVFQVVHHGVDQVLMDEVLRLSKEFFALPAEEKLKFDMTGGKRGGFLVSSHIQGMKTQDWREFLTYFTYPVETRDYSLWPEKPRGLTKAMEDYSQQLMGLAQKLLELLSEAMGLAKDAIAKACMALDQKVITNFYPKCPQPDLTFGLCRHTDPGTITILLQDQVGGLQVTRDGAKTWITVEPVHGAFVVNLGDHGYYLSNGRFKSADHRAVVNGNSSRFSVATFQYPLQESILYPLAIRSGEESIMEEPITFKEMYARKMDEARAKQGR